MSESVTIARPYAKAIFQLAMAKHTLSQWSDILQQFATIISVPIMEDFIKNPLSTPILHAEIILSFLLPLITPDLHDITTNLIKLLANNKRLLLANELWLQYNIMRANEEKTMTVQVTSFAPFTPAQEKALIQKLNKRLQRQITLNITLDPSILGGAVIKAEDLVIDGSVRSKLNKLECYLTDMSN